MMVKDLIRPIPGMRQLSLARQRLTFSGSSTFWERKYTRGGTSGAGSYGALGDSKAHFLNAFVREHGICSITEFGCGDGHQLSLADYPRYIGLDVSQSAIALCKNRFPNDSTKSFFLYDGACFVDRASLFESDMAISLDVVYHLIEDWVFDAYIRHLFAAARRYVVIYSTNTDMPSVVPQVRHRRFTSWVQEEIPHWRLIQVPSTGAVPGTAGFFVYESLEDARAAV